MNIISLLFSILLPPLGLPIGILGLWLDRKQWKAYIFCISLAFASITYSYQAVSDTDIVRYWAMAESSANLSFFDGITLGYYGSANGENLWVMNALLWASGRLGDVRLIPALSTFFVYYISLYITSRIGMDYFISTGRYLSYIIFSLIALNYFSISNNVRNVCAFLMIGYATFRDVYQHKRNIPTYLLYFCPILIHTSAIILLLLRLLIQPIKKMYIPAIVLALSFYPTLQALYPYAMQFTESPNIFSGLILKTYSYFNHVDSEWVQEVQASGSEKVLKILYITIAISLCLAYIWNSYRRMNIKTSQLTLVYVKDTDLELYNSFVAFVCLLAIACTPMLLPEYWRFTATAIALGGGICFRYKQITADKATNFLFSFFMLFIGCCCMILWVRYLFMYADVPTTLINTFKSSPVLIFCKILHLL